MRQGGNSSCDRHDTTGVVATSPATTNRLGHLVFSRGSIVSIMRLMRGWWVVLAV